MTALDARGISCPGPLMMLKKAMAQPGDITLLVDNPGALENCGHYAKKQGRITEAGRNGNDYILTVRGAQ